MKRSMNQEIIQAFIMGRKNRFSSDTISRYHLAIKQFFTIIPYHYTEIQENHIRAWIAQMKNRRLKYSTIQLKLTALKSFFQYCMEDQKLSRNPAQKIRVHKEKESIPYYLGKKEIEVLRELTKDNLRDRALFELLYMTGIRIDELIQLNLEDLHLGKREIIIQGSKRTKGRTIALPKICIDCIMWYLVERNHNSPYLFCQSNGDPITKEMLDILLFRFTIKLEIRVTPFTLRYTYTAHSVKKGIPVTSIKDQLGQVDKNSERIYWKIMNQARKEII